MTPTDQRLDTVSQQIEAARGTWHALQAVPLSRTGWGGPGDAAVAYLEHAATLCRKEVALRETERVLTDRGLVFVAYGDVPPEGLDNGTYTHVPSRYFDSEAEADWNVRARAETVGQAMAIRRALCDGILEGWGGDNATFEDGYTEAGAVIVYDPR